MNSKLNEKDFIDNHDTEYLYMVNYPVYHEELCRLEMKYIFSLELKEKYFHSKLGVDISRSPFIKEGIKIIYKEESLEKIISKIKDEKLSYNEFKIIFLKIDGDIEYTERMKAVNSIGFEIKGTASIHNPKQILALSKVDNTWVLGEYMKNHYKWHIHDEKPYSYSNGLSMRVSRALVNIAIENDFHKSIIDPCCGIGTVVIEGLSMNLNIIGYEINKLIGSNAKKNLNYLGYKDVITIGNMHEIQDKFDISIVDIPYGVFSPTTLEEQRDIIKTARKISRKMVIVTFDDMEEVITELGFKIIDKCTVTKGAFKRYINVCI